MTKYAILGSKVLSDVSKLFDQDMELVSAIHGYSLYSLITGESNKAITCDSEDRKMIQAVRDFNNTIFDYFNTNEFDYFVFDLLDCTLGIQKILMKSGKEYSHTSLSIYKEQYEKIMSVITGTEDEIYKNEVIFPLKNEENIIEDVKKITHIIKKHIPEEKIILLKTRFNTQYITKDNKIGLMPDINSLCDTNLFIDKLYKTFEKEMKVKVIPCPQTIICDNGQFSISKYNHSSEYYQYVINCIKNPSSITKELNEIQKITENKIKKITFYRIKCNIDKWSNGRKIIIIGRKEDVKKAKDCGIMVDEYVEYTDKTNEETMNIKLKQFYMKYRDVFFVIPVLYEGYSIEKVLFKNGFSKNVDYITAQMPLIKLRDFTGLFQDAYNNVVMSEISINVDIHGVAANLCVKKSNNRVEKINFLLWNQCKIHVGNNIAAIRLSTIAFDGSSINIGDNTTFAEDCHLRTTFFSTIDVGKDCMFSTGVVIMCGDGHAIFDIDTGNNLNYEHIYDTKITIGNHVWVGYQAFILSKTEIRDSSVVGARSLTNKKYPNNCIIAGSPAKIIRKNITWSRIPFYPDIKDIPTPEYINRTVE